MFKIVKERTFTHDVTVFTPVDGGHVEETVKATYRVIETAKAAVFPDTEQGSRDLLCAVLVKLDDLVGEDGKPVIYNDKLRDALLSQPHVRLALARGYFDAVGKASRGN